MGWSAVQPGRLPGPLRSRTEANVEDMFGIGGVIKLLIGAALGAVNFYLRMKKGR